MSEKSKEFAFQLDQLKKKKASQSISLNQTSDLQKTSELPKQDPSTQKPTSEPKQE